MNRYPLAAIFLLILLVVVFVLPDSVQAKPAWLNYPDTLSWSTLPNVPTGCCYTAGVFLDGKYYQISGDQYDLLSCGYMQVWDGASWQYKGWHPAGGIRQHSAAVWNNKIVVSGGHIWDSPGHYDFTTIFDPTDSSWVPSTPMPQDGLTSTAMACVNGICYLFGGRVGMTDYPDVYSWVPGASSMSPKSPMPAGRSAHSAAVYNGNVYIFGGSCFPASGSNTIFMFDPASNNWVTKDALLNPSVSTSCAVTIGDRIYIIGGLSGSSALNQVQIYDPINDTISDGVPLLYSTYGHAAAGTLIPQGNTVNTGTIYVSGGLANIGTPPFPLATANLGTVTGVTPNKVAPISLGNLKALYH